MRKITVSKKVKVITGTAMIVNTETEEVIKRTYTVRDTGYPEVELREQLPENEKLATLLTANPHEIRYSMDLSEFIRYAHPEWPFEEADIEVGSDDDGTRTIND